MTCFCCLRDRWSGLSRFFPLVHGVPRVNDRRVLSGIVYVIRNGLQWKDASKAYGPHKTLYHRLIRWGRIGVFNRIFAALTDQADRSKCLMINAIHSAASVIFCLTK
ncbi:transposase [Acetobacter syzygii]|uniref:transposase n=1 Tax=Acetobacter syzygii TaxID=146476 RepID=UPI0039EA6BD1